MRHAKQIRYGILFVTVSVFILSVGMVGAEVYKWVDENGVTHFSDSPTQQAPEFEDEEDAVEENTVTVEVTPRATPTQNSDTQPEKIDLDAVTKVIEEIAAGQAEMAAQDSATVELYVTSWCVYCKKARAFLRSRGIRFVEYDIEKDPIAARRMRRLTASMGVPFAMINGRPVQGFSEAAYKRALKK